MIDNGQYQKWKVYRGWKIPVGFIDKKSGMRHVPNGKPYKRKNLYFPIHLKKWLAPRSLRGYKFAIVNP